MYRFSHRLLPLRLAPDAKRKGAYQVPACIAAAPTKRRINEETNAENKRPEIPKVIGNLAVQTIDQARSAYNQFMESARNAQEIMKTMTPSSAMGAGFAEVQDRALRFTQQNLDAGFSLADELAKAKDLQEALQIQGRHAQLQMHAYALQAQELGALVIAAAQKGKQES